MTELVNQLLEEIKDIVIEPKYVAIKECAGILMANNVFEIETEKLYYGNDKVKLMNKLLEQIFQEYSLERYLNLEQFNCGSLAMIEPTNNEIFIYYRGNKKVIKNVNLEQNNLKSIQASDSWVLVSFRDKYPIKYKII